MRLIRALAALGLLAGLLVGVPWVLLTIGDAAYLLQAHWRAALFVTADSRLILALMSVAGWIAWLLLAVSVVQEVVALVSRQRIVIRLPGTGWLKPLAASLVVAAFAMPGVASAAPPDSGPVAAAPTSGRDAPGAEIADVAVVVAPSGPTYVVQQGDELWTVAEKTLGDGSRWRELAELNPGVADSRLEAGRTLRLPAEPPTVVVEAGDTLWEIAAEELGDPLRWPEIHELNRAQITDPDQIDVGWTLTMPASPRGRPSRRLRV